jgi:hypothetical protein
MAWQADLEQPLQRVVQDYLEQRPGATRDHIIAAQRDYADVLEEGDDGLRSSRMLRADCGWRLRRRWPMEPVPHAPNRPIVLHAADAVRAPSALGPVWRMGLGGVRG